MNEKDAKILRKHARAKTTTKASFKLYYKKLKAEFKAWNARR